jgi:putative ABC transport system permease protein
MKLDAVARELRHAGRRLVATPVFSLATILTMGLAIGANVAIFAVVYRVLLNPLPYGDSGRLVVVEFGMPTRNVRSGVNMTGQLYFQYLDRARTLDGLTFYRIEERTLVGQGTPERVRVSRTTPSLLPVLRVNTEIGRWFTDDEAAPGASPVAVLSHGVWVRKYGRNPDVIGRQITVDNVPTMVVGVMPPSFAFPDPRIEMWLPDPMSTSRTTASSPANAGVYDVIGVARLRDGVTLADARAELTRLAIDLSRVYPTQGFELLVSSATTLIETTVGRISVTLWILLTSVGLVLLVACANVANLFLVRSEAKQGEVAVRRALGAGTAGIAGYFLAESAWLATAGGALGIALAWGAVHLLVALGPNNIPRLHEVRLDRVAIVFAAALSVASGAVFGLIPLIRGGTLVTSLREGGRGLTTSRNRHRARHLLMGGQIAMALVLLISSGLVLRSFQKVRDVNPGFDPTSTLTFRVGLPRGDFSDYTDRRSMVAAYNTILDRLTVLPGVTGVSATTCLPLSEEGCSGMRGSLFVEGRPLPTGANPPIVTFIAVAGGYFETMRTPIIRGRSIERRDVEHEEPIVIVNEAFANIVFSNQDPIDHRVRLGNPAFLQNPGWLKIVGVASNTSFRSPAEANPVPIMYMPMFASRVVNIVPPLNLVTYVVRSTITPEALTGPAHRVVGEVNSGAALAQVRTMQEVIDRASAQMAFTMLLLVIASTVALLLGIIGIYGAMSYVVGRRTTEIGVRMALGARPGNVAAMILGQGGIVALVGISVGLVVAFAGSRLIESLLYGIGPRDPFVFGATSLALLAVALLACWLPARRAARLSPIDALRAE